MKDRGAAGTPPLEIHRLPGVTLADRAVTLVADRLADGSGAGDVAVLARVASALLPVQVALTQAGIPTTAPLDTSVLGRTGIRTALAYLRLGLDLERISREDLLDTINRPARKVKSAVLPLLDRRRGRGGTSSIGALEQLLDVLDPTHRDRFGDYLDDLRELEHALTAGADTASCLRLIRERIGLGEAMDALDASRTRPEGSSHGDDLDALEQLAALQPDPVVFRSWLADRLRVPGDHGGVTLSTIHRVKGLEWPHVLVFAANQGLFPHRLAEDVEEERRVFHVAITRCIDSLVVLADETRPSPFLDELHEARKRAHGRPVDGTGRSAGRRSRHPAADGPATPADDDASGITATPGRRLTVAGGLTGEIVEVVDGLVVVDVEVSGRTTRLRLEPGEAVATDGRTAPLVLPVPARTTAGRPAGHSEDRRAGGGGRRTDALDLELEDLTVDPDLYEALRAWRTRTAQAGGVPAYLVLHDRHLQVLAGRRPGTLRELAACPGIGPTKLDRFGDDLLDLIESHAG